MNVSVTEYCRLNELGSRVIGGSDASIANFPYQLSLCHNGDHHCGAVLISSSWALTAAHCTYDRVVSRFSLRAGTADRFAEGQIRKIAKIIEHPGFNPSTANNDITLLRPSSPFELGFGVYPISLPSSDENWPDGSCSVVSGWGVRQKDSFSASDKLQGVALQIVNQKRCNFVYRGRVSDTMLCAGYWKGGRDACQMDSGGPLAIDGKLVGIVSWGNECALPGFPGVYTRVTSFRTWITFITGL